MAEKDIRFNQKRVDESWKEQISREKGDPRNAAPEGQGQPKSAPEPGQQKQNAQSSKHFLNLVTSLGVQAMMHLGEMANPATHQREPNPEAAREMIDLIVDLREKTEGNLSAEEKRLLDSIIPELQMKYSQLV